MSEPRRSSSARGEASRPMGIWAVLRRLMTRDHGLDRRAPRWLVSLLALSLIANAFQLCWTAGADRVERLPLADAADAIAALRRAPVETATGAVVLVDGPELLIVENASLLTLRAILTGRPRRSIDIFAR